MVNYVCVQYIKYFFIFAVFYFGFSLPHSFNFIYSDLRLSVITFKNHFLTVISSLLVWGNLTISLKKNYHFIIFLNSKLFFLFTNHVVLFSSVSFMKERLDQDSVGIILLHNFLTEFFPGEVCGALKWLINV